MQKKQSMPKKASTERNFPEELYTPEEIAKYLKVAPSTIYNWVKTGKLDGYVLSKGKRKSTVRFDKDQIQQFIGIQQGGAK